MKKIYPVAIGVIKKDNKYLLTKRQSPKKEWNKWQFPGGGVEFGEKLDECLKRELKEEVGVEVIVDIFLPQVFEIFRLKDNFHALFFVYLCHLKQKDQKIILDEEASKYDWFTLEEIDQLDSLEGTKEIADYIKQHFS